MGLMSAAHESAPRSSLAAVTIRALASRFIAWRQQRSRRLAILSLMELEPWRLDDLGISVEAVRDAINAR